jgi:hypothetical protein
MQNEMDAAMLSMLGFNNRRFFESAFGLEPGERLTEGLLLDLTRRYEEGLAKFPINPSKRPKPSGARRNTGAPPSNKQLQGKLKAQRRRNRALKERLEKRDSDLEQARRKHRKAVRERDHTQRERDRFRALYVEIRQSRWWRYTLPLRKIAGAVRSWASRRPGGPGA